MSNPTSSEISNNPIPKSITLKCKGQEFTITQGDGSIKLCFNGFRETERTFVLGSKDFLQTIYDNLDKIPVMLDCRKSDIVTIPKGYLE